MKGNPYISVQLANKAGEVIMLKILRQKLFSELSKIPNNEAIVIITPRDDFIGGSIVHHIIRLHEERRRRISARNRSRWRRRGSVPGGGDFAAVGGVHIAGRFGCGNERM